MIQGEEEFYRLSDEAQEVLRFVHKKGKVYPVNGNAFIELLDAGMIIWQENESVVLTEKGLLCSLYFFNA
jgi:hypothetical protein